jgi:hypothetical protein
LILYYSPILIWQHGFIIKQDFSLLMSHLNNLTHLHLKGAGMNGPFPLLPVLRQCPLLAELILEKTPIHVPNDFEAVRYQY